MEPEILYEDSDIVALNKPAGLVVHADGQTTEPTLVDWLLSKYPQIKEVGEPMKSFTGVMVERPGIVHRLDRETSGVMLAAKTEKGFRCLKQQFHDRIVLKRYHAFVYGRFKEPRGVVDRPIGRSHKDFRRWSAERGTRGVVREALTIYRVIENGGEVSLIEAIPKTGRTHQIRVHMKSIGHPVVSDELYAPSKPKLLGFTRTALHARGISFRTVGGKEISIEAAYPADFAAAVASVASLRPK